MTRLIRGRTLMILSVFAVLGAGIGYSLSSWLVSDTEQVYRASVSGIFLTNQESDAVARDYVEVTNPSVTFVLRATPDPRSAWRAGYLAEVYSMAHEAQFDVSEENLYKSLAQGHTRVEARSGLEIITVTSWSEEADILAAEAISKLRAIDVESFGSNIDPLVVVSQRADRPRSEVVQGKINPELLGDVVQSHISPLASAPDFFGAKLFLEDFVTSDRFAGLSLASRNISARVLFSEERDWTIEFEGVNLEQLDDSVHTVGDFLRQVQSSVGVSENNGGAVFVESVTAGRPLQDAPPFSPVTTSTASGLFFGLALGWGVMAFRRRRSDQMEAISGSSSELGTGRRGQT